MNNLETIEKLEAENAQLTASLKAFGELTTKEEALISELASLIDNHWYDLDKLPERVEDVLERAKVYGYGYKD